MALTDAQIKSGWTRHNNGCIKNKNAGICKVNVWWKGKASIFYATYSIKKNGSWWSTPKKYDEFELAAEAILREVKHERKK